MWTHRFAILTAAATLLLLLIGGVVHGTGSSLACPDWPLCFGQLFPTMTGNVLVEHGHRLTAAAVGVLTLVLMGLLWRGTPRLRALGVLAAGLVMAQGLLGGLTVIYRLPTLISWAHLCTSMLFFAVLCSIACLTRPVLKCPMVQRRGYHLLLLTTALCYVQIAIGGLVRHTGGGLACLDLPLCRGRLLPLGAHPTVVLHALHRLNALLLLALIGATALALQRGQHGVRRALLLLLPGLVLLQIALGALSVWSYLGLLPVTAHLGVGALLLAALVTLCWLVQAEPAAVRHTTAPLVPGPPDLVEINRAGSARWGEAQTALPAEGGRERPPLIEGMA